MGSSKPCYSSIWFVCGILIILLSGCGIYNLDGFVMPDDMEFLAIVESLDTPEKIGTYMRANFVYEAHPFRAVSPYVLWQIKLGDCNDFSAFGTFIAEYHGYETWQIRVKEDDLFSSHWVGVYYEGWYSLTDCQYYLYSFTDCQNYWAKYKTFREIVVATYSFRFSDWLSYKVYDYEMNIIEVGINGR